MVMTRLNTFSALCAAVLAACGGSHNDCAARKQAFIAALVQAQHCTPSASPACAAYQVPGVDVSGTSLVLVGCSVGVNAGSTSELDTLLAGDEAAGCTVLSPLPCPLVVKTYTCQATTSGQNLCM